MLVRTAFGRSCDPARLMEYLPSEVCIYPYRREVDGRTDAGVMITLSYNLLLMVWCGVVRFGSWVWHGWVVMGKVIQKGLEREGV